jgi:peptidoglycan DL-endopeptidase CwlO
MKFTSTFCKPSILIKNVSSVMSILGIGALLVTTSQAFPIPVWPKTLKAENRVLLEKSLEFLRKNPSVPYVAAGSDTKGMDCSGAICCLLRLVGGDPPRSAHQQYLWLKKSGNLIEVPTSARLLGDPVFTKLQPGDLVFWAHDGPNAPAAIHASHVHLYLGKEADEHAIMIGSSDGRSYRGVKISGFGITDFRVPGAGSPTRIVGFGSPPISSGKVSINQAATQ